MTTEKTFWAPDRCARVTLMQHVEFADGSRGYVTKIGRKYVEAKIYGGRRVRGIDPLGYGVSHRIKFLTTSHT